MAQSNFTFGINDTSPPLNLVATADDIGGGALVPFGKIVDGRSSSATMILGNPDGGLKVGFGGSAGANSSIAGANSDTTLLAVNTARVGATIYNESNAILYALLANAVASLNTYTIQIAPAGYYEVPFGYRGTIRGIWASSTGTARITELT